LLSLQQAGMQVVAAHLAPDAVDYRAVDYTRPTAILLGAERRGISAAGEAMADACVTIPMVGMVESLNVSVAAGVILAEAQQQRQVAGMYDNCRIDPRTYERLFFEWGHSAVRDFCRQRGLRYPPLNAEGEIDQPAAWYTSVRAGTAPRQEDEDLG
jgi:tRNA (guanosine-2'-O-)-methyltransferase